MCVQRPWKTKDSMELEVVDKVLEAKLRSSARAGHALNC